jgi:hypothetical protein
MFLQSIWGIKDLSKYHKRTSSIGCGSLEVVKFFVSKEHHTIETYFEILLNDPESFERPEVYHYLFHLLEKYTNRETNFEFFRKTVKKSVKCGYVDFACSLFTNKNSMFGNDRVSRIASEVWIYACAYSTLEEIKILEPVFS